LWRVWIYEFPFNSCKNLKEAEKIAKRHIKEENSLYPGETYYKLSMLEELRFVDGYEIINYKLKKL